MTQEAVMMEPKNRPAAADRPPRRRPRESETQAEPAVRFFIGGKASEGGSPLLGKEFLNENEALIESLKTGVSFCAVTEYRAIADLTGKAPRIQKEAVKRQ
jgi:hypothetical protein